MCAVDDDDDNGGGGDDDHGATGVLADRQTPTH